MRFGASIWPWKWDPPYADAIERISHAGFRAVELIAWDDEAFSDYYTAGEVKHLRGVLDGEGMLLSQFVVKTPELSSPEPGRRAQAIETFKRGVDTAVELGTGIINTVVHYPFAIEMPALTDRPHVQTFGKRLPAGLDWQRNWEEYVVGLAACAALAEDAGIRYSLEPHPFRYGANTDGLLRILDAVDSSALGVNLDPSHLFAVGDVPNVAVQRLGSRVFHCHFSDNDGETNAHWRPGMGKIDWGDLLTALVEVDFDGVISLEFEDVPGVSRGIAHTQGAYKPRVEAGTEFEAEYRLALATLTELATNAGFAIR